MSRDRLELAIDLAHQVGELLREGYGKNHQVRQKQSPVDLLTEYDLAAESTLLNELRREFPGEGILSEEAGPEGGDGARWILDPLDGTTNFAHGLPFFCVSIAYVQDRKPTIGVVYAPVLDELFSARAGEGAQLNGRPVRVSTTGDLDRALLSTGFPYDIRTRSDNNLDNYRALALRTRAVRRLGSAALDMCYTAAGRFDGYWELATNPWDYAAGALLVAEAGGTVSQIDGYPLEYQGPSTVLATNGQLHRQLGAILRKEE